MANGFKTALLLGLLSGMLLVIGELAGGQQGLIMAFGFAADDPDFGQLRAAVSLDLVIESVMIAAAVLFIGILRSITSNLWRRENAGDPTSSDERVRSEREVQ